MSGFIFNRRRDEDGSTATRGSRRKGRRPDMGRTLKVESLEDRALLTTVEVDLVNFAFAPNAVSIHAGDTIHWVWDSNNHSTTSVAGSADSWDSGVHNTGFTFDHTFNQTGTFNYYCSIHGFDNGNGTAGGMSGTVTVLPASTLTSIMLMPDNPSVDAGSNEQFMAMGVFSDNSSEDLTSQVTWTSSETSVATVSNAAGSQGLATAVAAGSTTISATLNGLTGTTQLTVTTPAPTPTPSPSPSPTPTPSPSPSPTPTPSPSPTPTPSPSPTPVTATEASIVQNRKKQSNQVTIDFGGGLNAAEANNVSFYRLVMPDKHGSFSGKKVKLVRLKSAIYNAVLDQVTLVPKKPFKLKKPVELQIPGGLHDSSGRIIDGGKAATFVLTAHGVTAGPSAVTALGSARVILDAASADAVRARLCGRR